MTPERPGSVTALTELLRAIHALTEGLRADVAKAERARRRANSLNRALLVVAIIVGLSVGLIGWQTYRVNATIADCTTAGGRCYEESRSRTTGAVGSIAQISVFVSQCGRLWPGESGEEYDAKLATCVAERIKAAQDAAGARPAPAPSGSRTPR